MFGEIDDYRAVPVFAALSRVPLTGWLLALKVDREEVLAEFRRTGQLTGVAGAFLLLAFAACLIAFWRQRQSSHLLRSQVEQERAISSLRGYAEKIVASVPSGLLLLSGRSGDPLGESVVPRGLQALAGEGASAGRSTRSSRATG